MSVSILPLSIMTSFFSNLTIELFNEKISSWLAGLGDADKKNLNQAFKAICSDLAPAQQKQIKKLDEAKINIFKAAVYPIARYYSDDEKLDRIKKPLITTIVCKNQLQMNTLLRRYVLLRHSPRPTSSAIQPAQNQ